MITEPFIFTEIKRAMRARSFRDKSAFRAHAGAAVVYAAKYREVPPGRARK
jgi:hypothetical protein